MKLYLTLEDDDGQKVEKVLQAEKVFSLHDGGINNIISDMLDSLEKSKKLL